MRRRVCILSALFSLIGWGGAALAWYIHGAGAGVRPDFIIALSVGITAVLSWVVNRVMPDQAALYALGYRDGVKCADCPLERAAPEPPRRHLTSV